MDINITKINMIIFLFCRLTLCSVNPLTLRFFVPIVVRSGGKWMEVGNFGAGYVSRY